MRSMVMMVLMMLGCANAPEVEVTTDGLTADHGFFRQELDVPTVEGVVHTEVVFRAGAFLRHDRRVVVLIPGTLANGAAYYDIAQGTGYDAAEVIARENFFVVLVDLPGSGESFRPADGRDADIAMAARAVRRVSQAYRIAVGAHGGVDLYGETGVGTNVGLLLARETWVRSFAASATFYLQFGPAAGQLFDPNYYLFLDSLPTGYLPQDPAFIGFFFGAADPAIQAQAVAACVGPAPTEIGTGAFYDIRDAGFDPLVPFRLASPIVDAAPAEAPALFIQGAPDFIGSESGTAEMVAAYGSTGGGEADLVVLPGASHLMRFDIGTSDGAASPFWSALRAFWAAH